MLVCSKR